eukprot:TRINITY_DN10865_c0_g1_i1.p1 TRINITY_DN10865_c0_g1~~TRINITY_DN10865_c0_g1_i1.p1  ORF type:complete len:115 (-),score=11.41 TRINITY_DN10865_c0_g1_i1:133-477(-)
MFLRKLAMASDRLIKPTISKDGLYGNPWNTWKEMPKMGALKWVLTPKREFCLILFHFSLFQVIFCDFLSILCVFIAFSLVFFCILVHSPILLAFIDVFAFFFAFLMFFEFVLDF